MIHRTQPSLRRSPGLSTTIFTFGFALLCGLIILGCEDSEAPAIESVGDNTPPVTQPPGESTDSDRGEQQLSLNGCETSGNLPLDGLLGLGESPSPRANPTAEILALDTSGEVVAGEALYQRISAELSGLRSAFSNRTNVEASPCFPNSIVATLGDSRESTTLFDAYNTLLRTQLALLGDGKTVVVKFDGIYNIKTLAEQYDALPNIEFATPDVTRSDGSDICLQRSANDSHLYIFDQGSGDCPSGCKQHVFSGFTVDADGNIADLGSFQPLTDAVEPDWFAEASSCRRYL